MFSPVTRFEISCILQFNINPPIAKCTLNAPTTVQKKVYCLHSFLGIQFQFKIFMSKIYLNIFKNLDTNLNDESVLYK